MVTQNNEQVESKLFADMIKGEKYFDFPGISTFYYPKRGAIFTLIIHYYAKETFSVRNHSLLFNGC
jgi:hypothetical protein